MILPSPPDYDAAMERALRYLGARARSRREVADQLHKAGCAAGTVDRVLARLAELAWVDDAAYAAEVAAQGRKSGKGGAAVRRALAGKGVPAEVIDHAVCGAYSGGSERKMALEVASRRAVRLRGLPLATQQRRLAGYLARRGYDPEVASDVCRHILEDLATSD